jgi:hypothetical protein
MAHIPHQVFDPSFLLASARDDILALEEEMRPQGRPRGLFLAPLACQDLINGRLQAIITDPSRYFSQIGEPPEVNSKSASGSSLGRAQTKY